VDEMNSDKVQKVSQVSLLTRGLNKRKRPQSLASGE
jgi:hypothetical protein